MVYMFSGSWQPLPESPVRVNESAVAAAANARLPDTLRHLPFKHGTSAAPLASCTDLIARPL
jgi:hypothetical protein